MPFSNEDLKNRVNESHEIAVVLVNSVNFRFCALKLTKNLLHNMLFARPNFEALIRP